MVRDVPLVEPERNRLWGFGRSAKEVAGLMLPHAVESGAKGSPQKQKITIDQIEVNVPIDDARFVMPEVKPEEPAPKQ